MTWANIEITTPFIKLEQLLKFSGLTETGGQAKHLIQSGFVFVNGEIAKERGKKIYPGDEVILEDAGLKVKEKEVL